ncbi:MAG: hypothetical protein Q8M94_17760 [Ignavibacteria bacterium]|nr:hypothetical protein [Ignavibacteria bacterium]
MIFNGKEISIEELNAKMMELKVLQGLQKEAKKAGLIIATKAVSEAKEKSANYALMVAQFTPMVDINRIILAALFTEFAGQDSISFDVGKEYHIIVRSKAIVKQKQDARKEAAKIAEAAKTLTK